MHKRFRDLLPLAVIAVLAFPGSLLRADVVKLKNGGEVRGRLVDRRPGPDEPLTLKTLSGAEVTVPRADVQMVVHRPLRVEVYETKAKRTPETVEAQLELADWCRENRLNAQRETHLRKVVELEPDHRDARLALGYSNYDGRWMTRDEYNRSRGLVKYRNRYVTPEELQIIEKTEAELERERGWFRDVRLWKTWVTSNSERRRQTGLKNLSEINDPDAVAALQKNFSDDDDKRLRMLYVKLLGRMKGPKPVPALAASALHDSESDVRYEALNGIARDQHGVAAPYFVNELRNESVVVVKRAGNALQRVGDETCIPALIGSLVTTHRYKVRVPRKSISVGTNGTFGGGQSVVPPQIELMIRSGQLPNGVVVNQPQHRQHQMGRTKVVTVRRSHKNMEVLKALERITGKSFGYNERDWRLWLASSKNNQGVASP